MNGFCQPSLFLTRAALFLAFIFGMITVTAAGPLTQLQKAASSAIKTREGTVLVADVVSGRLLVAVNPETAARALASPGSTLKPFVLMALLESGVLDANHHFICRRSLTIGGVPVDCTHPASVKIIDAELAIAYSCNSYVAASAARFTPDDLVDILRRAGLDSMTGLMANETTGYIDRPNTQDQLKLEALGMRGIEVSPLELLNAYRKLALQKRSAHLAVDSPVFLGLEDSVTYGMAHAAYVRNMRVTGKTGTAASRASMRTHGFFVGYAPADKPEIVIAVFLEQGRGMDAAAVAQPVLAEFAREEASR